MMPRHADRGLGSESTYPAQKNACGEEWMRRFGLRWEVLIVAAALVAVCGCSGSSNETTPQPAPVPAVCSTAFNTDDTSGAALVAGVHRADEGAPVALSTCLF